MSITIELHETFVGDDKPCGMQMLYENYAPYSENRIGMLFFYEVLEAPQVAIRITNDARAVISGAIVSVFTTIGEYLSSATTNANGECALYVPKDGYITITKDGYQSQRHNYAMIPTGFYMDLTLKATTDVVGNRFGYSVSLSPSNPQGTDYF